MSEDPLQPLRELLAQMPLVDVEASAFAEEHAGQRRELDAWAARTIEMAQNLEQFDVVKRVAATVAEVVPW